MERLKGKYICALCQDWSSASFVESDQRKFALARLGAIFAKPGEPPIRFGGTRDYQRYLKSRGMTDDVSTREVQQEVMSGSRLERHKREATKQFISRLEPAMRQRDARWLQQHRRV